VFKGVSQCVPAVRILNYDLFNPLCYSPLPLSSFPHYSTAFSTYPYVLYLHRCNAFQYCWLCIILFTLPSSPNAIKKKCVLHINLYIIMFVLVYMFIFCFYLPCLRENMWLLSFWTWLISLKIMASNFIHLPSHQFHYSLWLSKTPLCIYTTFS
jgi:hypothetical protein